MSQPFVLVVHDGAPMLEVLRTALQAERYECSTATDAQSAFEVIERRVPDTVLLSLDLPHGGVDLCRRIRLRTRTPVIAISENHSDARKVSALDAGADDYLTIPFSMPEVLARLRVAIRHRRTLAVPVTDSVIELGPLRLDPAGHAAALGTRVLTLTPKEFQLLVLLARNEGRVLTHQSILEAIWPSSKSQDSLRLHISQLRKKLAQSSGAPTLVTLPGVGYRLGPTE